MKRPRSRLRSRGAAFAAANLTALLAIVLRRRSRRSDSPEPPPLDAGSRRTTPSQYRAGQSAPPARRDGADTITRNTAFALASQLATASFTALLTIVLVRVLGPEDYGVFALALSVASLVFLPADFGISQSTARFVAEHRGERQPHRGGDGGRPEAEAVASGP